VHERLQTPTGLTPQEYRGLRETERRILAAWHLEKAGDDDGRPWWPWAIRRLPADTRLILASEPDRDAAWVELERRRVARDLRHFAQMYGHLQGAEGDAPDPFLLWPEQREVLDAMQLELRLILLKARQLGLTWLALHYGFWLQAFNPTTVNAKVMALSKDGGEASKLLGRSRRINQLLPPYLRHAEDPATRGSLSKFKLLGRGTMISLTSNPAAARSETARLAILDEAAFVRNKAFSATHTAVQPSLGQTGQEIVLSTGNGPPEAAGDGQGYARLWTEARAGRNSFRAIFLPDSTHPERTPQWRAREQTNYLTDEEFYAEHPETEDQALMGSIGDRVYSPAGLNAAAQLGHEYDQLLEAGDLSATGRLVIGIDWGEHTHALLAWPLEAGGLYIAAEIVCTHEEPGDATTRMLEELGATPRLEGERAAKEPLERVEEVRYDSAGIQSQRTFNATARGRRPDLPVNKITFNSYKRETIGYLRRLVKRAGDGKRTQILALSEHAPELLRQMRGLEWPEDGGDLPIDGDDHGPDALICVAAPIARRWRDLNRKDDQ
jgi:hypothetical protein